MNLLKGLYATLIICKIYYHLIQIGKSSHQFYISDYGPADVFLSKSKIKIKLRFCPLIFYGPVNTADCIQSNGLSNNFVKICGDNSTADKTLCTRAGLEFWREIDPPLAVDEFFRLCAAPDDNETPVLIGAFDCEIANPGIHYFPHGSFEIQTIWRTKRLGSEFLY